MNSDAMTATRGIATATAPRPAAGQSAAVVVLGALSVLALPVIAWQSAKASR